MIEFLGILAGCCVLISFTFKDEIKIRKINIIGCILFIIYGLFIKSISVIFLNTFTFLVHILYLKGVNRNE